MGSGAGELFIGTAQYHKRHNVTVRTRHLRLCLYDEAGSASQEARTAVPAQPAITYT